MTKVISGRCHCGQVGFEITQEPKWLSACNCSICRRLAPLWGYIDTGAFRRTGEGTTIAYMQGDRTLAMHTCVSCGCTTHWEQHHPDYDHMAVNFRMCDPDVTAKYRVRRFDGADTWEYLD